MSPPKIIVIPTQGFCNRLRTIASTYILANFLQTDFYVIWEQEECCNCQISDIFATSFPTIDFKTIISSKYLYLPDHHTNTIMHIMHEYEYVVIKGGHEFKHPSMDVLSFIQQKHFFYNDLKFSDEIMGIVRSYSIDNDCVGIHYRDFIPKYDALDGRNFSETSPLDSFLTIVSKIYSNNRNATFFISSNTDIALRSVEKIVPKNNIHVIHNVITARDTKEGIIYAVANLLVLSKCKYIVGTLMSSYSDEACFFNLRTKLCLGNESITGYHCYGFENVLQYKMLLPNLNILYDIYKEIPYATKRESFEVFNP